MVASAGSAASPSVVAHSRSASARTKDRAELGAFLVASHQQQWRLKAVQGRRTHVEQSIRNAACDLDVTTEKRGSPHTLVAIKNQASYERRAKQRRQDLKHVSALGG
jgi:hypothetical protein